jgi:hypothetical protein
LLGPDDSLVCTYETDLPDAQNRENTATATQQNYDYDKVGVGTPNGTTYYEGEANVDFVDADITKVDECIDVWDDNGTPLDESDDVYLGKVCADDDPADMVFEYSIEIGPYDEAFCEETFDFVNTASFVTNDTDATGEDNHTVAITVSCVCTLTQGYWKTHSEYGPAPYDDAWALLGDDGADTPFFESGLSYYDVLWTSPKGGNAYYILAHQYVAAELNKLNGAVMPSEVQDAFDEATGLFETYTPAEVLSMKGKNGNTLRAQFINLAGTLASYNEGVVGPGHCSE